MYRDMEMRPYTQAEIDDLLYFQKQVWKGLKIPMPEELESLEEKIKTEGLKDV